MIPVHRSSQTDPTSRGRAFGELFSREIQANISRYSEIFNRHAPSGFDLEATGAEALAAIAGFAPPLHAELLGMAEGAGIDPRALAALNARTEVLAALKAGTRGECSAVLHLPADLGPPVAVQTWDWYQIFRDAFLVWEIPHADGTVTKTMTEYGILGKAGLNTRGIGLLFTILHHSRDGGPIGVPVHIAARAVLDRAATLSQAGQILALATFSASSSLNMVAWENGWGSAMTAELHPDGPSFVLPDDDGLLVHTNHFLAAGPAAHDTEPGRFPDTLLRRDFLRRRLAGRKQVTAEEVMAIMSSHSGGEGAVCCHPLPGADPASSFETLATIALDVEAGELSVLRGGPCGHSASGSGEAVHASAHR